MLYKSCKDHTPGSWKAHVHLCEPGFVLLQPTSPGSLLNLDFDSSSRYSRKKQTQPDFDDEMKRIVWRDSPIPTRQDKTVNVANHPSMIGLMCFALDLLTAMYEAAIASLVEGLVDGFVAVQLP